MKALVLICAALVAGACSSPVMYTYDASALSGLPAVTSAAEAWAVSSSIVYDGSPDCKCPPRTYREGRGDCKDIAALMVALLESAGIDSVLVIIILPAGRHMIVYTPGYGYLEPQVQGLRYDESELDIVARIPLAAYLGRAI